MEREVAVMKTATTKKEKDLAQKIARKYILRARKKINNLIRKKNEDK